MFYKKIAVSAFLLMLFCVFASAQTAVPDESAFKSHYYAGTAQDLEITQDIDFTSTLGVAGDPWTTGAVLDFNANLLGNTLNFSGLTTGMNGGVFLVSWLPGRVSFSNGKLNFENNSSSQGGGTILISGSNVFEFLNTTVNFTSNTAGYQGGAISNYGILNVGNSDISFTGNNCGIDGGALFMAGSSVSNFTDSSVVFSGNSTPDRAGAAFISDGAKMNFTNSTADFTVNTSGSNGGAIYVTGTGALNIENSGVSFTGNAVLDGGFHGGAIASYGGKVNIAGSAVTFDANKTVHNGGGVYLVQSAVWNVDGSSVSFSNNSTPEVGGAGLIYNSLMTFTNSKVDFTGNSAGWFGGALDIEELASVNFINSTVNFEGNQAGRGGAIALLRFGTNGASVNFENSDVYFTGNSSPDGGAIRNEGQVTFNPGAGNEIVFSNNTSNGNPNDINQRYDGTTAIKGLGSVTIGGGISGSGLITKEGGGTLYINGNSGGYGGVYTQIGGVTEINAGFFNGTNNINGGTAKINDGAIINSALIMSAGSLLNINVTGNFDLQHSKFAGSEYDILKTNTGTLNIAEDFGANTGTFTQETGTTNVSANYFSGASNINGGTLNFNTGTATAGGNIALASAAALNITGTDTLALSGAVSGTGAINKTGSGTLKLSGNNSGYSGVYTQSAGSSIISAASFSGAHNINGGNMEWATGTVLSGGSKFYIGSGSALNITSADDITIIGKQLTSAPEAAINKTGLGKVILEGDISIAGAFYADAGEVVFKSGSGYSGSDMKINGAELDMNNGSAVAVKLTGNFESDTNIKMDVFSDGTNDQIKAAAANIDGNIDIFAGVGKYNNKEYKLIITGGESSLNGVFASSSIFSADNSGLEYELIYEDGIVKLIVNGMHTANFTDLGPLTYNQKQTSKAFEKISENPGNWAPILNEMVIRQKNGTDADIAEVKNFLSRTSGYFLANVIRNFAADSPNNEVYDKIRRQSGEWGVKSGDTATDNGSGLWVQVKGGVESFKKDENSLEDYKDLSYGVMLGFDRFLADSDLMWGAYARINKDNVEQGKHKADGNKNGLGLYGGYLKDGWELKAMLLGSYDRFSTERAAYDGTIAKADINGVTVSADLEAAIKIWLNDDMNFRPYAGAEAANSMYGGFKESGAGIYDLDTRSGNYLRTAGRIGAGLDYEKGRWIWYANVEGKYIIDGTKPEVKSQFADTGIEFYSRGAKEGSIQIGAGLGGEVKISENWKGFANAKYYAAERYENAAGNIGVRYMFGKNKSKEEKTRKLYEEAKLQEELFKKTEAARLAEQARLEKERVKQEEAQRKAEEANITKETSGENTPKQQKEAQETAKKPIKTYTLTTHFRTNEYVLTDEFKEHIKETAKELRKNDYKKITIKGHTDSTGTKEWNSKLSRQRAKSVYDELIRAGVDASKIEYRGYSYTMPVASNKTAEGRAANRRTEVFVE